jgi:hypothetical protein
MRIVQKKKSSLRDKLSFPPFSSGFTDEESEK